MRFRNPNLILVALTVMFAISTANLLVAGRVNVALPLLFGFVICFGLLLYRTSKP